MKRKAKVRDAERTRRRILEAACGLFGRKGYDGTNMREIGACAKIRAATVYHYFRSKRDILFELFESFYRELTELYGAIDAELPGDAPLGEALARFLERHRAFVARRRDFSYLFFTEGLRPGSPIHRRMKALAGRPAERLKTLASRWDGYPPGELLTLFMAIVGVNVFSEVAGEYLSRAVGVRLSAEEQTRVLALLLGGRYGR
jgi:AcrR family transcriptional regulator